MDATILSSLLVLLQLICVVVVVACLLIMSRFVIDVHDGRTVVKMQSRHILVLCILSIYGTVSGVKIPGALVNVREHGPKVIWVK